MSAIGPIRSDFRRDDREKAPLVVEPVERIDFRRVSRDNPRFDIIVQEYMKKEKERVK